MANEGAMEPQALRRLRQVWPWPGLPEGAKDVLVPPELSFEETQTLRRRPLSSDGDAVPEAIASGPVALLGRERDLDDGRLWLRLAWLDGDNRTQCHLAPRTMLGKRQPDDDAVAAGLPVLLGKRRALAEVLARWETMNRSRGTLPTLVRTGRPGWVTTAYAVMVFALPAGVLAAAPGDARMVTLDANRAPLLDLYKPAGAFEEEREAVMELLVRFPRTAWVLGHGAAAIGMRWWRQSGILDVSGYAVEIVSDRTGVGKSFAISTALVPWGSPNALRPFVGTEYGLAELLYQHSDLPLALQEAQAEQKADPGAVIHALADGGSRLQGHRQGGCDLASGSTACCCWRTTRQLSDRHRRRASRRGC